MGVSLHSLTRRIPMVLGPVLDGIFIGVYGIEVGARISYGIAFILGLISLLAIHNFIDEHEEKTSLPPRLRQSWDKMSRELRILLLSDIFVRFAEQIPCNMWVK